MKKLVPDWLSKLFGSILMIFVVGPLVSVFLPIVGWVLGACIMLTGLYGAGVAIGEGFPPIARAFKVYTEICKAVLVYGFFTLLIGSAVAAAMGYRPPGTGTKAKTHRLKKTDSTHTGSESTP